VPPGGDVRGIEFPFHSVTTVSVKGHVTITTLPEATRGDADRSAIPQASVVLTHITPSTSSISVFNRFGLPRTQVHPDGSFELTNVIPGPYNIVAFLQQHWLDYSARLRIDVGDRGAEDVGLTLRPAIAVPGQILIDGTPPSGFKMNSLHVTLLPTEDLPGIPVGRPSDAAVAEDGRFVLPNVSAQTYRVRVQGGGGRVYLVNGRIGGEDAVNRPVTITGDQDVNLQLQIGFQTGQVSGTVVDAKGNPYAGGLATLIPDEPARLRADLYFSTPTDQYGHFLFSNIPPGRYKLFAWEDVSGTAYQDPEFIQRYEAGGVAIKVDAGGSVQQQVSITNSR
jgi:hypothetical protein